MFEQFMVVIAAEMLISSIQHNSTTQQKLQYKDNLVRVMSQSDSGLG